MGKYRPEKLRIWTLLTDCNPFQDILGKLSNQAKLNKNRKTLISVFAYFLSAKDLFMQGRLNTRMCPHAALRSC